VLDVEPIGVRLLFCLSSQICSSGISARRSSGVGSRSGPIKVGKVASSVIGPPGPEFLIRTIKPLRDKPMIT
jgi:hypothetical protein